MDDEACRLTVAPSTTSWVEVEGEQQQDRPAVFLDFFVNDQSIRDLLDVPEDWEEPPQGTTPLRDDWRPKEAVNDLDRLLGLVPGDYDHGRVSLLVCEICGDVWCGALSMELTMSPQSVT